MTLEWNNALYDEKGVAYQMKINTTGLRRRTTHEPKSLVAKDSPDDFEYEGANVSPGGQSSVAQELTEQSGLNRTLQSSHPLSPTDLKSANEPYVKVDNPDDFE